MDAVNFGTNIRIRIFFVCDVRIGESRFMVVVLDVMLMSTRGKAIWRLESVISFYRRIQIVILEGSLTALQYRHVVPFFNVKQHILIFQQDIRCRTTLVDFLHQQNYSVFV